MKNPVSIQGPHVTKARKDTRMAGAAWHRAEQAGEGMRFSQGNQLLLLPVVVAGYGGRS